MKTLIYTDLHCSKSSSIMPIYSGDKIYTTRLRMIVQTGQWLAELADQRDIDIIVNGGDTFDSHTVSSEELTAMSDFMSPFNKKRRHIIIAGNHDISDRESNFASANILRTIENVEVYNTPTRINEYLSVLPFIKAEDVSYEILAGIKNRLLVSHIDIKGSMLRPDYIMDTGVDKELLAEYFEFVANGHLHTAEKIATSKHYVSNIGSVSSSSFNDSNEYYPSACIFDTDKNSFERIRNPHSILFRKVNCKTIKEFIEFISELRKEKYKFIVRVTCPYSIRQNISDIISDESDKIVAYRINATQDKSYHASTQREEALDTKRDIKVEFVNFIKAQDSLNYPLAKYLEVINSL